MPSKVTLLYDREIRNIDSNFLKLAEFLGIRSEMIDLKDIDYSLEELQPLVQDEDACLAAGFDTLSLLLDHAGREGFRSFLQSHISYLFTYHGTVKRGCRNLLKCLSRNAIVSSAGINDSGAAFHVTDSMPGVCRQFSGLSIIPKQKAQRMSFIRGFKPRAMTDIITIKGQPFFSMKHMGKCRVFLLASQDITDIDRKCLSAVTAREHFAGLIPPLMFLHHAFGESAWHSPGAFACFILDDPLLKMNYGFHNYSRLIDSMDRADYCTSIAFIPYNYHKNQDKEVVSLLRERQDRYSLCFHGCDHTWGEFGHSDPDIVGSRTARAVHRMEKHREQTRVMHDRVMVFPQGIYSTPAMEALKHHEFLGAVNTSFLPVDHRNAIPLHELMRPAIMRYGNIPLLTRRYPGDIADFAMDLFLSRPALAMEHHDYFRFGYQGISEFVNTLRSISPGMRWEPLRNVFRHSYLMRRMQDGTVEVRLFTRCAFITNSSLKPVRYVISKDEPDEAGIEKILVDGKEMELYSLGSGSLTMTIDLPPSAAAEVEVVYRSAVRYRSITISPKEKVKVLIRRSLSEMRDNYISRSMTAIRAYYRMIQSVRRVRSYFS